MATGLTWLIPLQDLQILEVVAGEAKDLQVVQGDLGL
jgi:hypothetical protein